MNRKALFLLAIGIVVFAVAGWAEAPATVAGEILDKAGLPAINALSNSVALGDHVVSGLKEATQ